MQALIYTYIYLELPQGFDVDDNQFQYVLKLKKNLYGLKQARLSWYKTLRDHLQQGFKQSESDLCFFHQGELILVCYVDDCLIFAHQKDDVNKLIATLQENFVLTDEGDITMFLGIQVEKWDNKEKEGLQLSQPHLMRRIIDAAGLTDQQLHDTPATKKATCKESNSEPHTHT